MEIITPGNQNIGEFICRRCGCVFKTSEENFFVSFDFVNKSQCEVFVKAKCGDPNCHGSGVMNVAPTLLVDRLSRNPDKVFFLDPIFCNHTLPITNVQTHAPYTNFFCQTIMRKTIYCPICDKDNEFRCNLRYYPLVEKHIK